MIPRVDRQLFIGLRGVCEVTKPMDGEATVIVIDNLTETQLEAVCNLYDEWSGTFEQLIDVVKRIA